MPIQDIYGGLTPPVVSPAQVQNGLAQNAMAGLQLQNGLLDNQQKKYQIDQDMAQQQAIRESGGDPAAVRQAYVQRGLGKALMEHDKTQAQIAKDAAAVEKDRQEALAGQLKNRQTKVSALATMWDQAKTPEDAVAIHHDAVKSGLMTDAEAMESIQKVPTDPAKFADYKAAQVDAGKTLADKMKITHELMVERGLDQRNAATLANHIVTTKMTNDTSRANNAATQAGENARHTSTIQNQRLIAGLDPQTGNFQGGGGAMDGLIDGIGQGKIPESTALGRVPPGMKAQVMQEVMKRYPDYDPTALQTRGAANKAFTSGKEAQMLRSIGTAIKHLDMVGGMVDALNNGNIQIFNKLGQAYAQQTGATAPTNFDAAKEIVGQEVVKSIVANGGGVKEREEAAAALDKAKSPAQLLGVIQTYKTIMGAQRESLLQQRDAAGLPRSTLPDYTEADKPAAGLPSGWKIEKVK